MRAGLRKHDFKNTGFGDISGLALNARLRWYPSRLVSVRFDLAQNTTTSSFDSVSAVTVTSARASADYEFRRNVLFGADLEGAHEKYSGPGASSNRVALYGRTTWKLNRSLKLSGRIGYERRGQSAVAFIPSYDAFRVGLTLSLAR